MEKVIVELQVPKESKEVVDLLDAILEKVLAKAEFSTYADILDELMLAIDGVQNIPAEMKDESRNALAAYLVHVVMTRLMPVTDQPAADPA